MYFHYRTSQPYAQFYHFLLVFFFIFIGLPSLLPFTIVNGGNILTNVLIPAFVVVFLPPFLIELYYLYRLKYRAPPCRGINGFRFYKDGVIVEDKDPTEIISIYSPFKRLFNFNGYNSITLSVIQETARYMKSPKSISKIQEDIQFYNIEMKDFVEKNYESYDDFFIRQLKDNTRTIDHSSNSIVSPVDGKCFIFPNITLADTFFVKQQSVNLDSIFTKSPNSILIKNKYRNGCMFMFRLAPYDYHRFHFPLNCVPGSLDQEDIGSDREYHSNSLWSILAGYHFLTKNIKKIVECKCLDSDLSFVMILVGGMEGSNIYFSYSKDKNYLKGEEMGYFNYGGSTVLLIFPENTVKPDITILKQCGEEIETAVKMGEVIATLQEKKNRKELDGVPGVPPPDYYVATSDVTAV